MIDKLPSTISELHEDLKNGAYSLTLLVDSYLSRIHKYDKGLNSFITVMDEKALEQAKRYDEIIKNQPHAFEDFPLLGVVFSLKDLYTTKGTRTTAGSKVLETYIPQYTATSVERLEKAGAIFIGKTNCDAWGHGSSGENSDYGSTRNPWDMEYISGGSSSGSGVSVAAGFCMASMGTDTGGSVRNPASRNNISALKPTYGSVPRYGVIAMASSLDTIGHFANTVEDVAKIYSVTAGKEVTDATSMQNEYKINDKIVLGIPDEYFAGGVDPEVKEIVKNAIAEYEKMGITTKRVSLPHTKYAISAYYIIQPAEVSSNLARYDGVRYGNKRDKFGDEAKRRIMLGSYVLSSGYYDAYYLRAMKARTVVRQEFEKIFKEVDALIAPVAPTPPAKIGEKAHDPMQMYLEDVLSVPANLAGIPALALPGGFTKSGMPIGFQIMGDKFSEKLLFSLGKKFQDVTTWHKERPSLK